MEQGVPARQEREARNFGLLHPSTEARDKLLRLTNLEIEGKVHEVTVHLAVPDDFSRGVIHGIGLKTSLQKITQGIAEHEENPRCWRSGD